MIGTPIVAPIVAPIVTKKMLKKLNEKKDQKKKKNLIQVVLSPTTLAQLSMMNNNSFVIPIIVKDDVLHIQSSLTVGTWMTPKEQTQHYYQSMVWGANDDSADDSGANDADKKSKMKKKRTNDNYVVESWMFGNIHVGMVTGPYFEYNNNNNSSSSSTTTADNSNSTTTNSSSSSSSSSSVVTAVLPLVHAEYYPTVGIERMDQIDAMKTWMCTRLLFSLFTIIYLLLYIIFICTTF